MSSDQRRTETVYNVIKQLIADGKATVRPGDVNAVLRERNSPIGTWQVRADFTYLEGQDLIACDPDTGDWRLTENASLKDTG